MFDTALGALHILETPIQTIKAAIKDGYDSIIAKVRRSDMPVPTAPLDAQKTMKSIQKLSQPYKALMMAAATQLIPAARLGQIKRACVDTP